MPSIEIEAVAKRPDEVIPGQYTEVKIDGQTVAGVHAVTVKCEYGVPFKAIIETDVTSKFRFQEVADVALTITVPPGCELHEETRPDGVKVYRGVDTWSGAPSTQP